MKNTKSFRKTLAVGIILLFIGTSFVSALSIEEDDHLTPVPTPTPTLVSGIIFVLDCSGSIDAQEFQGMKNAIAGAFNIPCGYCDATGLVLGVVTFTDHAFIRVPPSIIDEDYTTQDFLNNVAGMSTPGGSGGTAMYTGVIAATGLASFMIIMTDDNPGPEQPAVDACEVARLLGQKIGIAHYPPEEPSLLFPFDECTNSDGQYPDQPIGYHSSVSDPLEMRQTVSGWIHNEFELNCWWYC